MVHAIRIHETGGPEVLRWDEVEVGSPGPGQVRLRHTAIGLNFIDTYHRSGLYPVPLPAVVGSEGAGVVVEAGPGVSDLAPGDRVAYAGSIGSYAEERLIAAASLVPLPRTIDDRVAAAAMLKGMTAEYLLRRLHRVEAGEAVLIHAAAGGVGLIASQWAHALGALVIGTVSTDEKAALAAAHGCDNVIVTSRESVPARVRALTGGKGVRVVYDGVGKDTWEGSLDSLAPRGVMVSYGNASGAVPPISPLVLGQKGSLFLTRPSLMAYIATREELLASAASLFDVVGSGTVKVEVTRTWPLREAAEAHRALEGRRTTGSVVLLP